MTLSYLIVWESDYKGHRTNARHQFLGSEQSFMFQFASHPMKDTHLQGDDELLSF